MMQTKRGAKPVGSFSSIEAIRGPGASRGRWARSSRAPAEAEDKDIELEKMLAELADMKLDRDKASYQYELALGEVEWARKRAYAMRRPVAKGIEEEYLRSYRAYEVEADKVSKLEFKLRDYRLGKNCPGNRLPGQFSNSGQSCRTVSSEASESPSEDFRRRPSSV